MCISIIFSKNSFWLTFSQAIDMSGVRPERGVTVETVASWSLSVQCNQVERWSGRER
jgi:hypothetical protein